MTKKDIVQWLDDNSIETIVVTGVTHDSVPIGKHLNREKFLSALDYGFTLSDITFGWDVAGELYFQWWDEWRARGFIGEIAQQPDPATLTRTATAGVAQCLSDFITVDGSILGADPRSMLKREVVALAKMGYVMSAAYELEFMVFQVAPTEARERNFNNLNPLGLSLPLCYLSDNLNTQSEFMDQVVGELDRVGVETEGWSSEAAPGQIEINFLPTDPVTAADWVVQTRQILRSIARRNNMTLTFISKPVIEYGNGTHVHHSLLTSDGNAVFYDQNDPNGMSQELKHWVAGLMSTLSGATSLMLPTINSYRRLEPFSGVPTHQTWALDDKSVAIRVLTRSKGASRVEHRVPGGESNPYLALAAIIAGGRYGLENEMQPPPLHKGLAYFLDDSVQPLPDNLWDAAVATGSCQALADRLGRDFIDFWVYSRKFEWISYHDAGLRLTQEEHWNWEVARNFEIP